MFWVFAFVSGGAVTIGLDRDAVDAYVRSNPTLDTVEEFLRELVETGFIPEEVVRRCKIVANLLDSGDMHVVLENLVNTDTICAMAAERIANRINNPPMSDDTSTVTPNPQVCNASKTRPPKAAPRLPQSLPPPTSPLLLTCTMYERVNKHFKRNNYYHKPSNP